MSAFPRPAPPARALLILPLSPLSPSPAIGRGSSRAPR